MNGNDEWGAPGAVETCARAVSGTDAEGRGRFLGAEQLAALAFPRGRAQLLARSLRQ